MLKLVCILLQVVVVLGSRAGNHTKPTTKPITRLLDKFYQTDYKVTFERIEFVRVDKRYAEFQCNTFKYNRTTPASNGTLILKIDVGYQAEIIFQAYRFASNEYRLFPIRFQINFCDAIASSALGLEQLKTKGNIVCPMIKGKKYYAYYFTPDEERFPPLLPNGQYMVECQFMVQSKEVYVFRIFFTIYRPIAIPDF